MCTKHRAKGGGGGCAPNPGALLPQFIWCAHLAYSPEVLSVIDTVVRKATLGAACFGCGGPHELEIEKALSSDSGAQTWREGGQQRAPDRDRIAWGARSAWHPLNGRPLQLYVRFYC